jgi:hypothetical protein
LGGGGVVAGGGVRVAVDGGGLGGGELVKWLSAGVWMCGWKGGEIRRETF